jgi:hypothetical protein
MFFTFSHESFDNFDNLPPDIRLINIIQFLSLEITLVTTKNTIFEILLISSLVFVVFEFSFFFDFDQKKQKKYSSRAQKQSKQIKLNKKMSKLLSYYQLCPVTDEIIGVSQDCDENSIIITLGKKIVYIMQVN